MAHDVFVSYASEDQLTAEAVLASLEHEGIRSWIACRNLRPGDDYGEHIIEAIKQARVFLLIFSSHANQSRHVRIELERAVSLGVLIIPFRIENVVPAQSLEYGLSSILAMLPADGNKHDLNTAQLKKLAATRRVFELHQREAVYVIKVMNLIEVPRPSWLCTVARSCWSRNGRSISSTPRSFRRLWRMRLATSFSGVSISGLVGTAVSRLCGHWNCSATASPSSHSRTLE
jgi:TIR domain-containing protein